MAWQRWRNNKFGAKKITYEGGLSFASKLEASVYTLLKAQENAGEIEIDQTQEHVYLSEAKIVYIADFKCRSKKNGSTFFVEAKGFETPEWRLKRRLWMSYGPGELHIYKGTHLRPFLHEILKGVK